MWPIKPRSRRIVCRKESTRRIVPLVETFEPRLLLSTTGFLQGTVFVDNNGNNQLEPNDPPLAGAIVALTDLTNPQPTQTVTTGSDGSYLFTGLTTGDSYQLVETPPSSYANQGTQANSPLNPVTATTSNSITVTVQDLSDLSVSFDSTATTGEYARDPGGVSFQLSSNAGASYTTETFSIGQLPITVTGPGGTTPEFSSYCVDAFSGLSYSPDVFSASGLPMPPAVNNTGNAGRIAFLYNQYGSVLSPTSKDIPPLTLTQAYEQQALQLAIWKLEYDSVPDSTLPTDPTDVSDFWSTGNLKDLSLVSASGITNDTLSDLENLAIAYINQSVGQSEQGIELAAIPGASGYQSLLAPGSLNFSNIPKASPAIATTASATANDVVGSAMVSDSATLSGGDDPTGTITFTLTAPDDSVVDTETVNVNGDGSYTTSNTNLAAQVGTYTWSASYSGDGLNNGAVNDGKNESVTIVAASPTLVTTASFSAGNVVGSAIPQDSAVLSGGYDESGTITFTLTAPDHSVVDSETVTPSGDGTYTTSNMNVATEVGTYTWTVGYAGDGLNNGAADQGGTAEQVTTIQASPSITTTPSTSNSQCSSSLTIKDTASLTGGDDPTGTITFTLYNPNGKSVDTETVNVSGDGSYTTPTGYTLPTSGQVSGTYQWDATYDGDNNNNSVSDDNDPSERVTVGLASPSISTTPSTSSLTMLLVVDHQGYGQALRRR